MSQIWPERTAVESYSFGAIVWWQRRKRADRCRVFVDSGMPEFQVLGFHLSGHDLHELPASARSIVESAWRNELAMHSTSDLVPRDRKFPI